MIVFDNSATQGQRSGVRTNDPLRIKLKLVLYMGFQLMAVKGTHWTFVYWIDLETHFS